LSGALFQGLLDRGFDLSISHEWRLDYSFVGPALTVNLDPDLPIVPLHVNTISPPLPSPRRFYELGQAIREIIDTHPASLNVAAIGSGTLSFELGAPRQLGIVSPDPVFDTQAIRWLVDGDIEAILEHVTHESLARSGNATSAFLSFLVVLGMAGPIRASYADDLDLFGSREMYITWYPSGDPR
jgi:protocatechuate 4,5-dioxygenase beta chain